MKNSLFTCMLTFALAGCTPAAPASVSQLANRIDIPYQKFVLKNGLTLIVHEDHKAPIVAVNVWYHVGSKNECPGKTGFAHLFEHLMFNGSEHFNDDYFQAMERIGSTDLNGTTSEDRTDYFENVPKNALDVALWMESDRMGHLLGAIDQAKLDEQRGVVQNEKRQGENQPYGLADLLITKGTAPTGHPYSWPVIGSMEDLNAASLDDVRNWFKTCYGAANAVLVIAGDVEPNAVLQKVQKYFGDIPAGPPVSKWEQWIPRMTGTRREIMQDRVPQARIYKVWNIPGYGAADTTYLELLSDVLASGKTVALRREEVRLEDQRAKAHVVELPVAHHQTLRLGVIDLPSFSGEFSSKGGNENDSATKDVALLLHKLKALEVKGVVLDLRQNSGSSLPEAISLTGLFIRNGLAHDYDPGTLKVTISKFYRPDGASTQLKGIQADIILPSLTDNPKFAESAMNNPLPWDRVPPARHAELDRVQPYLKPLQERSSARVASNEGFAFLTQEIAELRKRQATKAISLNEAVREKEKRQSEADERTWEKKLAAILAPSMKE
jgi:hypothetical protein